MAFARTLPPRKPELNDTCATLAGDLGAAASLTMRNAEYQLSIVDHPSAPAVSVELAALLLNGRSATWVTVVALVAATGCSVG